MYSIKKNWTEQEIIYISGIFLVPTKKFLKIIENNFCKTFAEHVAHLHAADFKKRHVLLFDLNSISIR